MSLDFTKPYCLVHKDGKVFYASGPVTRSWLLADVPRPTGAHPVISMVPYPQVRERGYVTHDNNEPVISLVPEVYRPVELTDVVDFATPVRLATEPTFAPPDEVFAQVLHRVITQEIQRGEGSNFLISRRCDAAIADFGPQVANVVFGRLSRNEIGAYLSFCFYDGERYFIGSSPERHLTYERGRVLMNPICGTLPRKALRTRADLVEFLTDPKEINELFQVVDEELKMMSRICGKGGVVRGPYLREMSSLVHTEYVLDGSATMDPIEAFRESMYAATMIGSPLENAARVIHRHEYESRGYYTGALVLMGLGTEGDEYLDSAITIRTMEVTPDGKAVLRSGASIVRDSVPAKECAEVRAKAAGLLTAITSAEQATPYLDDFLDDELREVLTARNEHLSRFWVDRQSGHLAAHPQLVGRSVLLIDNEDQFTQMLKHVLEHQGLKTTICDYRDADIDYAGHDLVLVGPGPGDPNDLTHPKMARLHEIVADLLERGQPFLAVCLGHQILCRTLGLTVAPVDPPLQGVQKAVDLFGRSERVGFYNTFFAQAPERALAGVEVSAEPDGRVIALRAPAFYSFQFHVESVLTTNCVPILQEALTWLLSGS
ncbi:MAG: phenazine biosynthesis protein PhzE [Actinobacteria bacterium]|nr:MAG: phenazine biosynthesis protein PhzE [Actinomycetota bacterium]